MPNVLVIGAGTMGAGIAQIIAQYDYEVTLLDSSNEQLAKGRRHIEKQVARLVQKGEINQAEGRRILDRIHFAGEWPRSGYDVMIEAVTEQMRVKQAVFEKMVQAAGAETVLASNTSSLSISEIASVTGRAEQVIGLHFFNPPAMMKLVEVVRTERTSERVVETSKAFVRSIGKEPIEVNEAPGFVVNRMLVPMINEAAFLLLEGVADAREIDQAMKWGANHPIGPLALADLIGLDVCLHVMEVLYTEFSDSKYRPCSLLRKMVRSGRLGRKTGAGFYDYG